MNKANILAGADQQGDDDKNYVEIPLHTIMGPNDRPYLSIADRETTVSLRLHHYDDIYQRGIFLHIDKKAIPEMIAILEKINEQTNSRTR
jgi:hypothetical protein